MVSNNGLYIQSTNANGSISYELVNDPMIKLFIIIGCLMFASEVPKLLEKLLGISAGNFSLNPFKNSPLAAAAVGGTIGSALGMGFNAWGIQNARKRLANDRASGKITEESYQDQIKNLGGAFNKNGNWMQRQASRLRIATTGYGANILAGGVGGFARSASQSTKGNIVQGVNKGVTQTSQKRRQREAGYHFVPEKVYDVVTDMAGIEQKTGTTSVIKDKIKQAQQIKENATRDEAMYSMDMGNMRSSDPKKTASYSNAFATVRDSNGVPIKDENDRSQLQYNSYNDYIRSLMAESEQKEFDRIMNDKRFVDPTTGKVNELARNRDLDDFIEHRSSIDLDSEINRTENNSYRSLFDKRETADALGHKQEKEIKRLQEMENLGKGKQG